MIMEEEANGWDFTKYKLSRKKAIRLKCLDCCCYQQKEVKLCTCENCPLYPYRMGVSAKVPNITLKKLYKSAEESKSGENDKQVSENNPPSTLQIWVLVSMVVIGGIGLGFLLHGKKKKKEKKNEKEN